MRRTSPIGRPREATRHRFPLRRGSGGGGRGGRSTQLKREARTYLQFAGADRPPLSPPPKLPVSGVLEVNWIIRDDLGSPGLHQSYHGALLWAPLALIDLEVDC